MSLSSVIRENASVQQLPSERTCAALRVALRKIAADAAAGATASLDEVASEACADARARAVPIEQLIVAMKREWTHCAAVHEIGARDGGMLLARLVSACIHEYYRLR